MAPVVKRTTDKRTSGAMVAKLPGRWNARPSHPTSGSIAAVGMLALSLSQFAPTARFGLLMTCLLLAALIGDLVLLPAMLAMRGRRRKVEEEESSTQEQQSKPPLRGPHYRTSLPTGSRVH